ncbi:hypothetical protein F8388_012542 [Cannabis sativa]|uniref:RRM domain-containing protein n=2 Tax=Cannabis sativa TaxID=3483 RepID=A0A7J6H0E2_CANSA|nr:hypothetical protein G4B88_005192 [Cannabis sativa]KAF4388565.1 hypothetical protein F8388_012542 [Cannabis sativa]
MAYHHVPGPSSGSSSSSGYQFLNSPFGDTTYTKVFVGGLAWETQSETMRRYFEQFGDILEAVVITDKNTGRSKGYGFVTFRDPESARRACADPAPIIDGRRANCNLASLGRPRPPMPYGRPRPSAQYIGNMQTARGSYVGSFGYQQQPLSYSYQGLMYPPYGYVYLFENEQIVKWHNYGDCSPFTAENLVPLIFVLSLTDGWRAVNSFSNSKVLVAEDMCPRSMFIEQARLYATYGPEYVYPQSGYNPYAGQQYLQIYGVPAAVNSAVYPYGQVGQSVPSGQGYTNMHGYTMQSHQLVQFSGPGVNPLTTSPMPTMQTPYPTGMAAPVMAQPQFIVPAPSQYVHGGSSDQTSGSYIVMLTREVRCLCRRSRWVEKDFGGWQGCSSSKDLSV